MICRLVRFVLRLTLRGAIFSRHTQSIPTRPRERQPAVARHRDDLPHGALDLLLTDRAVEARHLLPRGSESGGRSCTNPQAWPLDACTGRRYLLVNPAHGLPRLTLTRRGC